MTAGPGRFDGKVVVVTGAGSGIGAAAADRFLAEGARVVYADRDAGRLSRAAASESVLPVAADVADPASVSGLVTATLDRFGKRVPQASGPIEASMLTLPSQPAHVLLISTGHSRFWGTARYYGQAPYLTVAAAERIIEAEFGLVGLDFGSPDETGSPTEPCHHALLGAGVLIIENLNGLPTHHWRGWDHRCR